MVVKVLIKRRFKKGKAREGLALLNNLRSDAVGQRGYISGETLVGHDDPQTVLVISLWYSLENWLKWKENKIRKDTESELEKYLAGKTKYEIYALGTDTVPAKGSVKK
jgi:heme-degrading monooxygenase HmoA